MSTQNGGCGCGGSGTASNNQQSLVAQQPVDPPTVDCPATVSDIVCLEADLEIIPSVTTQTINVICLEGPVIGHCTGITPVPCTFTVSQKICAEFMLNFSATAQVNDTRAFCSTPTTTACPTPPPPTGCTHTIGFWKNQGASQIDAFLPITLGSDASGFSYTVTTQAEALAVLNFNTPSPPSPGSMQYQQLYAQLLAANLNVANGADCAFADTWIAVANNFLATSPQNDPLASQIQTQLETYNSGHAAGCGPECP